MTYSEGEIRRQLSLGEDSHWEFKQIEFVGSRPRSPMRDDLADEIAAGLGIGRTKEDRVPGRFRRAHLRRNLRGFMGLLRLIPRG